MTKTAVRVRTTPRNRCCVPIARRCSSKNCPATRARCIRCRVNANSCGWTPIRLRPARKNRTPDWKVLRRVASWTATVPVRQTASVTAPVVDVLRWRPSRSTAPTSVPDRRAPSVDCWTTTSRRLASTCRTTSGDVKCYARWSHHRLLPVARLDTILTPRTD